jgi:nitrate reductase NapAB chaperone NapD
VHYSGILVYAKKDLFDECLRQVDACEGVEVHFSYPDSHRLIAVLETETVEEQEEGLRNIQSLSGVAAAELVYHYFGDGNGPEPDKDGPAVLDPGQTNPENRCQGASR